MPLSELWYKNAMIYAVDIDTFQDSNGDGIGDFPGLTSRLDYLMGLGVTCLWLLPFYPTPNRDNGYDVANYYGVDPRYGDLGDFVEFMHESSARGIRVIIDLVINHTSNEHPWFQEARRNPDSPYRDYYVWADKPVDVPEAKLIFPGVEQDLWAYDDVAGKYFWHRFYSFQPDLNTYNPAVRDEIHKIIAFWLELGVSGFRIDAAPYLIKPKGTVKPPEDPIQVFREMRDWLQAQKSNAIFIAESDVEPDEYIRYFDDGESIHMLFNFILDNYLFLAFARQEAAPAVHALGLLPHVPRTCQWTNFLRNLDELDLERLSDDERQEVYRAFAPEKSMRIYRRGIRRRMAPMFHGNQRRIENAFSLLFSLPGAPVLVYGDEIGMGENLALDERNSVRTPMQWSDQPNAGFSKVDPDKLIRPVIDKGQFRYQHVNVTDQQRDPHSLLNQITRLIRARKEAREISTGKYNILNTGNPCVLALHYESPHEPLVVVHNLADKPCEVSLNLHVAPGRIIDLIGDQQYDPVTGEDTRMSLGPYGYRWLRIYESSRSNGEGTGDEEG